jgi:hypothetical protein
MSYVVGAHLEEGPVVRSARRDHHVVDGRAQVGEELIELRRVPGVEGGDAERAELVRRLLQSIRITAGEDHVGAFGPGPSCGREPDARAPADQHDGLPEQLRFERDRVHHALTVASCACSALSASA